MYKIPATSLFLGKNLIFMPECHSTNDAMLLLCQESTTPEGTLVITARQTAGRGQRGNTWEAEAGKNLTFTLLVKPTFLPVQNQFYLNIVVSLGIRDYLTEIVQSKVQIKWPNDVLVNEKKISGILIENQLHGSRIANCAIGIGLNINQRQFSVPTATSLVQVTGHEADVSEALDKLVHRIEVRYLQLRNGHNEILLNDYLANLFMINQPFIFADSEGNFSGKITGIDNIGRLQLLRDEGLFSYDVKQLRYVGHSG